MALGYAHKNPNPVSILTQASVQAGFVNFQHAVLRHLRHGGMSWSVLYRHFKQDESGEIGSAFNIVSGIAWLQYGE